MLVQQEQARNWYKQHGGRTDAWDELSPDEQNRIALKATLDQWDELHHMTDTESPVPGVLTYFKPGAIGLASDNLEFHQDFETEHETLTSHVLHEAPDKIRGLFTRGDVQVNSVRYTNGFLELNVSAAR